MPSDATSLVPRAYVAKAANVSPLTAQFAVTAYRDVGGRGMVRCGDSQGSRLTIALWGLHLRQLQLAENIQASRERRGIFNRPEWTAVFRHMTPRECFALMRPTVVIAYEGADLEELDLAGEFGADIVHIKPMEVSP